MVPVAAPSGGAPLVEIGTYAGLSIISPDDADEDNIVSVGIPGGGLLSQPMVFASFFPRPKVAVEPQLNFSRVSSDGESVTILGLEGRVAYLFAGAHTNSPYVSGHGALLHTSFDEVSDTNWGVGVSVGNRQLIQKTLVVKFEAGYRHWFDEETAANEFTVRVGIAAVLAAN